VSKPSKCLPYVDRREDGTVYSQHRVPEEGKPSRECAPTFQAGYLLADKEAREAKRKKRLKESLKT